MKQVLSKVGIELTATVSKSSDIMQTHSQTCLTFSLPASLATSTTYILIDVHI
jgi:hypothetical protein